jgi:ElaB/YqjD/DUF883 family membrane-anchored ribosome-binding protein
MDQTDQTKNRLDDATAQIVRLREQVEALMKERVTPAVAEIAGRAEQAVYGATSAARDQAEAISNRVRDQPLLALLIAAGVGFVIGRVTR